MAGASRSVSVKPGFCNCARAMNNCTASERDSVSTLAVGAGTASGSTG